MSAILYKDNPYGGTTSVMDASHVLVEQGNETVTAQSKFNTYTTTIQRILGNFATVEESAIASKAYGIGDYIILNSFLYKVKTAIEVGDPIDNTAGGNVVKTNVGDEFKTFEFPVREMVKAQYDALPEATKNDGTMYMITDDNAGWEAESVEYDNTASGLSADNVQDAVDELDGAIEDLQDAVGALAINSGQGYCKLPDGTMMCWGKTTLNVSSSMSQVGSTGIYTSPAIQISFPTAFASDSNYTVTGTSRYSTGNTLPIGTFPSSASKFNAIVYDFYSRSLNDGNFIVRWQAVGRWKST